MNIGFLFYRAFLILEEKTERNTTYLPGAAYGLCYKCIFDHIYDINSRLPLRGDMQNEYISRVEDLT